MFQQQMSFRIVKTFAKLFTSVLGCRKESRNNKLRENKAVAQEGSTVEE